MDQFLNDQNVIERLIEDYNKYKNLVVAYDFDNTVYDFHHKGYKFDDVIELLRECDELGFDLIVYTASEEENYPFIEEYLQSNNIPFKSINTNPSFIPFNGKKIYFNILLDDRAGLSSAYYCLKEVVEEIKGGLTK